MEVKLLGIALKSPVLAGSSPWSLDGDTMIRLDRAGAGAVVTKNVCLPTRPNPYHYMRQCTEGTLINCERALDYSGEQWIEQEIPKAASAGVKVIANIGMSMEQVGSAAERVEASGAAMIECVSYRADWLVPLVEDTKRRVKIPVIAKLSPNYRNLLETARLCREAGADAFTCGDSIGPVMKIDIETGKPFCGGADGIGWMSGKALKPFAVKNVADLRANFNLPIIGMGGVSCWEDCIEMVMAGADAVSVCSALVTEGPQVLHTMSVGVQTYLEGHHLRGLHEIQGCVHRYLSPEDRSGQVSIVIDRSVCTHCGTCARVCVYGAIRQEGASEPQFDVKKCRSCGMCSSICRAISEK